MLEDLLAQPMEVQITGESVTQMKRQKVEEVDEEMAGRYAATSSLVAHHGKGEEGMDNPFWSTTQRIISYLYKQQRKSCVFLTIASYAHSRRYADQKLAKNAAAAAAAASHVVPSADYGTQRFSYNNKNYRAFCFVIHKDAGILLLQCTRKNEKGPHFQIPGGHVDEAEFIAAGK